LTHIVAVRSGTTLSMYYNGTRVATTTNSYNFAQAKLGIGSDADTVPLYYTGYISNARLVKGTAVYDPTQTTLTVPTAPLTAITNTSLLCLQDNRFIDNSSNAFAITRNGDTRISKFAPFNPPASYSTATYGGSGYFDGGGDFLSVNFSSGSTIAGDFTWETWVYELGTKAFGTLFGWRNASTGWVGFVIYRNNSENLVASISSGALTITQTSGTYKNNQWNHVALVRSGSTVTLYVNGTSAGSGSYSSSFNPGAAYWTASDPYNNVTNAQFAGYIGNQRFDIQFGEQVQSPGERIGRDENRAEG